MNLSEDLTAEIKGNRIIYQKVFGTRFWEFEFLVDNFMASFTINRTRSVKPLSEEEVENVRDERMAKNFAIFYQNLNLKGQKLFGFFGREHTYQAAGKRTTWMTARIKTEQPKLQNFHNSPSLYGIEFYDPNIFLAPAVRDEAGKALLLWRLSK